MCSSGNVGKVSLCKQILKVTKLPSKIVSGERRLWIEAPEWEPGEQNIRLNAKLSFLIFLDFSPALVTHCSLIQVLFLASRHKSLLGFLCLSDVCRSFPFSLTFHVKDSGLKPHFASLLYLHSSLDDPIGVVALTSTAATVTCVASRLWNRSLYPSGLMLPNSSPFSHLDV